MKSSVGKVSIIVPVYNRSTMLGHVLASIQDQTYENIEVIVVDDGSDDLTESTFSEIRAKLRLRDNVRYVRKRNGGVSSARNCGIANSTGEYIYFLDSDDLVFPDAIENLVAILSASPESYCIGKVVDVDFDIRKTYGDFYRGDSGNILRSAEWNTHASLYRRQAVLTVGRFDESLRVGEDTIFQLKMILAYGDGARCSKFIGVRRRHKFGHLSFGGIPVEDQARFMVAFADIISRNEAFRGEMYRVRLTSTALFLSMLARAGLGKDGDLRNAFQTIAGALMHDSKLMLAVLNWLSEGRANLRLVGMWGLLATAKRLRAAVLAWHRHHKRHELRDDALAVAVRRLSGLVSRVEHG